MKMFKYRQHYAWGLGDWKYLCLSDDCGYKDSEMDQYLDDRGLLDTYSDKFRRVTWKKVKTLPRKILVEKIKDVKTEIEDTKEMLKDLNNLLKELPKSNGKVQINIFTDYSSKKTKAWATVNKGRKTLYTGRHTNCRIDAKDRAQNWCDKNHYEVLSVKYEKPIMPS
jgi:hypothetical protein